MTNENAFHYTYSAPENREVLEIRKKYLPREETKFEELLRLDGLVQNSGIPEALCAGIGGALIFGLGLCLCMKVIGDAMWLGLILGLVGSAGMLAAYPMHRKLFQKAKQQHTPRILELTAELANADHL